MKTESSVITGNNPQLADEAPPIEATPDRERGRKAILAGWLVTMAGVFGYVFCMLRAPEGAGMLEAIRSQGVIGWATVAFLIAGISLWLAGNISMFQDMMSSPDEDDTGAY